MRTISQDSTLGDRWRRRKSSDDMRVNENTVICGDKVILVPYRSVTRMLTRTEY